MNRVPLCVFMPCDMPETGAALFISLVFLLILTIIGLAGTQNTALQELMAGHLRDGDLAFQAAESALVKGEADLASGLAGGTLVFICTGATDGLYVNSNPGGAGDCPTYHGGPSSLQKTPYTSPDQEAFWTGNTDVVTLSLTQFNNLAEFPKYVMEVLSAGAQPPSGSLEGPLPVGSSHKLYRITARGTGIARDIYGKPISVAVTQSVVRR